MRQQRESAASETDILKQIEADERAAYAQFEKEQKEKRQKALSAVIDPLRTERQKLCTTVNDAHTRIAEIDKQLAKLTGAKPPEAIVSGKKRQPKRTEAEKLKIAGFLFKLLKDQGGEVAPKKLEAVSEGIKPAALVALWNANNKADKITVTGHKASTRYSA